MRRSERLRERSVEFLSHDPPYSSTSERVVRKIEDSLGEGGVIGDRIVGCLGIGAPKERQ